MDSVGILITSLIAGVGILVGAIGNKIISNSEKSNWIAVFYFVGFGIASLSIVLLLIDFANLNEWPHLLLAFMNFVVGMGTLVFTGKVLSVKNVFSTIELTPKINELTDVADKSIIKLFGGDLDFFGSSPKEMDLNSQYTTLKAAGFKEILIICEAPIDNDITTMVRYGKILTELTGVELKFYNPKKADLRVRGRILKKSGSDRLLMFNKIASKTYKALETDTADSTGALYGNIWDLIWSLANIPKEDEILKYRSLFLGQ